VKAHDLSIGRDGRAIVSGINLEVALGEVVAVLGPNGCGKTTLLDTLAGLIPPIAGTTLVSGQPPFSLKPKDRARLVAGIPQSEPTEHGLSALETVCLGRYPYSRGIFDTREDRASAIGALAKVNANDLAARPLASLSGGERQRVFFARVFAQASAFLVADEPTANLDPDHQCTAGRLLREFASEGKGVVVATHDLAWAGSFADRALLIADGRVVACAEIERVLAPEVLREAFHSPFLSFEGRGRPITVPDHLGS